MKRVTTLALAAIAVVGVSGCSSPELSGPEKALAEFYDHLNEGNYPAALALYSAEAREVLEDPDVAGADSFAEWAEVETKGGNVDRVRILQQSDGDEATAVEYEVVYDDGSTKTGKVSMILENGEWRLGLLAG